MNDAFKLFIWLVFELILGPLLFSVLICITISIAYVLTWSKDYGLDGWILTILEFCKGTAFTIEAILYLAFILKSAYNFITELMS